ncbi:MAG: penicillin-binding protein 2 [Alphaproteobacteria bacterium]|nr:penicillin-binding protein 2 [Alphaproteobacteria bacterium]
MRKWRRSKHSAASRQPSLPGLFTSPKSRRLATPHEQALDTARIRLVAGIFVFALAYTLIAGRLAYLTLMNDTPEIPVARPTLGDSVASRADITDRNGITLATSLPTTSLCVDAKRILDAEEAARELLAALPDLDAQKLREDLHSAKRCAIIKRHLTPKQSYEVNKLGIAGLEFRPDERRIYPTGRVAAHVVGYTDIDNKGLAGVEKQLDKRLQQERESVALSLDLRLQTILQRELNNSVNEFRADAASGLIMDIATGEILAMVSLPDFEPQRPGKSSDEALFNRSTLGVYEMGSTFKIFNTALALDSGLIHTGDSFDAINPIQIGGQTIRDFHPENRWLNVAEIFTHSSNIGSARMAARLGGARQRAFLARLGLTEKLPLELPEVGAPLVPATRDWGETTTMTAAYGHGIAVNAVQLASAAASIANDGIRVRPTLLKKLPGSLPEEKQERVVSSRTSSLMRGLMRLVVTHGTAREADVPGYMLGGKTGTADKLGANRRYTANARLSSFVGVFPLNAPKYLVFAMLDNPKGNTKTAGYATGGWVAAPAVGRVVAQIGSLLDLPPMTANMEAAAERQVLKPLGVQMLDGKPVEEGSNYASIETDSTTSSIQ